MTPAEFTSLVVSRSRDLDGKASDVERAKQALLSAAEAFARTHGPRPQSEWWHAFIIGGTTSTQIAREMASGWTAFDIDHARQMSDPISRLASCLNRYAELGRIREREVRGDFTPDQSATMSAAIRTVGEPARMRGDSLYQWWRSYPASRYDQRTMSLFEVGVRDAYASNPLTVLARWIAPGAVPSSGRVYDTVTGRPVPGQATPGEEGGGGVPSILPPGQGSGQEEEQEIDWAPIVWVGSAVALGGVAWYLWKRSR